MDPTKGEGHPMSYYPSVDVGPVSINCAKKRLGFRPTSLDDVMKETLTFFRSLQKSQYINEKIQMLIELPKRLRFELISKIAADETSQFMELKTLKEDKVGKKLFKKWKEFTKMSKRKKADMRFDSYSSSSSSSS